MSRSILLSLLVVCLSSSSSALAQDRLVGKRVVVINDKAPTAVSGKPTGTVSECSVFTVDKVEGEWLWIKSEKAYLRRADVIPFEDAIAHYTRKLETDKTANNYWHRSQIWRLKGELDIALGDMNEAIRLNPTSSSWFNSRGNLWKDKKEEDKALADYSEAIRLDPKNSGAYVNRGRVWRNKKDFDKAIADCNEALKHIDPNEKIGLFSASEITGGDSISMVNSRSATLNSRGVAWENKKVYDKALADYEEAIRLDPKYPDPRINRRNVWFALKAWDKLIADCDNAIQQSPKDAALFNWRGVGWESKKEYDKALADYEEAIRLDPKYQLPRSNRRDVWGKRGEYDKVVADLEAMLAEGTPTAETYISFAWLRATCPDEKYRIGKKAVEFATKACELSEWKDSTYIGTLAAAYAEAGEFDKALEYLDKAESIDATIHAEILRDMRNAFKEKKPYHSSPAK